jgi:hypothetical protein
MLLEGDVVDFDFLATQTVKHHPWEALCLEGSAALIIIAALIAIFFMIGNFKAQ